MLISEEALYGEFPVRSTHQHVHIIAFKASRPNGYSYLVHAMAYQRKQKNNEYFNGKSI